MPEAAAVVGVGVGGISHMMNVLDCGAAREGL